jgi:hypothetical protein
MEGVPKVGDVVNVSYFSQQGVIVSEKTRRGNVVFVDERKITVEYPDGSLEAVPRGYSRFELLT